MELITKIDNQIALMGENMALSVTPLNELLISLAKQQGEAKKKAKNLKTSYEINFIKRKEEREFELKKIEGSKITDAELTRYAERELVEDYADYKEQESISDYLTPILEAYTNYVAGFKSDRTEGIKITCFNTND